MASEIRVDKITSLSGVGTISPSPTGVEIAGITTVATLKVGSGVTLSPDGDIFTTGISTFGGNIQITGADDQDNLVVNGGSTQFAVHQDDSDGEVSLRAQDGSGNNFSKFMTFYTQESGSAAAEKLRITSDGKVGIGTVSPNSLRHIHQSSTSGFDGLRLTNSTTGVSATSGFSIELTDNETTRIWNYGNESIQFGVDNELHGTLRQDGRWCLGPNQTSGFTVLNVFSTNGPSAQFLSDSNAGIEIKDSSDSSVVELTNNNGQLKIDLDHTAQVTGEAFIIEKNGGSTGTAELFRIDSEGQVIFKSMTTTERNALSAQTGGVIYNSSTNKLQVYTGSAWVNLH